MLSHTKDIEFDVIMGAWLFGKLFIKLIVFYRGISS
jgi:hypothetical protein